MFFYFPFTSFLSKKINKLNRTKRAEAAEWVVLEPKDSSSWTNEWLKTQQLIAQLCGLRGSEWFLPSSWKLTNLRLSTRPTQRSLPENETIKNMFWWQCLRSIFQIETVSFSSFSMLSYHLIEQRTNDFFFVRRQQQILFPFDFDIGIKHKLMLGFRLRIDFNDAFTTFISRMIDEGELWEGGMGEHELKMKL